MPAACRPGTVTEQEDDAQTGVAPTELGQTIDDTEAVTAWSLDNSEDEPTRRLTAGRITGLAVAASVAAFIVAVGAAVGVILHGQQTPAITPTTTLPATVPALPSNSPAATTPTIPVPQATEVAAQPATVALPSRGGIAYVGTRSGKTACEITYGYVACNVAFVVDTPLVYGTPANVVTVSARGDWNWGIGDRGQQSYPPLAYGTTYRGLGWTVKPASDGTTFINDATGHGMTVSVEGVMPF